MLKKLPKSTKVPEERLTHFDSEERLTQFGWIKKGNAFDSNAILKDNPVYTIPRYQMFTYRCLERYFYKSTLPETHQLLIAALRSGMSRYARSNASRASTLPLETGGFIGAIKDSLRSAIAT